jgi:hypothetical protein
MSSHDLEHYVGTALLIASGVAAAVVGGIVLAAFAIGAVRDVERRNQARRRKVQR